LNSYVQGMQVIAKLTNQSDVQLADTSVNKINSESLTINNVSVKL